MTTLDERYPDLLNADDVSRFAGLVAELDTLREGSPSPRGDMMIRHALAVHARDLAQQGRNRPTPVGVARQRRWTRPLKARLGVAVAAFAAVLLSVGTYLHGQGPTPVSAQTVLHRAAAASLGPNEAIHATYRVSSSDGRTGTADVWIGYNGSGAPTELALNLTMSQDGHPAGNFNGSLIATGPNLLQVYRSGTGGPPDQMPVPATPVQPASAPKAMACVPCGALKGMVVGTLLAQKLSAQPNAYTLHQETVDGVSVYALQYTGAEGAAGGATFYFNAQTYVLQGADWVQGGTSWQTRLDSYSTMPLSAVPAGTFGSGPGAWQPGDKPRAGVTPGSDPRP